MKGTDKESGQVILFTDAPEVGEVGCVEIKLFEPSMGSLLYYCFSK